MSAHGDAGAGGHAGPDASDENVLLGHGVDDLLGGAFGVEKEAVGLRGNVGVTVAVQPLKYFLAHTLVDALAFGDETWVFEAGRGCDQGGDGHEVPAGAVHDLFEQVGTSGGESAAQAGHAVGFREGAEHDDVLARLNEVERRGSIAKMDVGFVNHHDGTLRFVFDKVFEVGVGRERAGGIVRIANVKEPRVGSGGDHGLDVVRVSLSERNFDHTGTGGRGRHRASFITRIGSDVASLRRRERYDREAKRGSGAGEGVDVIGVQSFLLGEGLDEFVGKIVEIASAKREDGGHGVARGLARSERILVGVDHDRLFGEWPVTSRGGQHGFGDDLEGRCGG